MIALILAAATAVQPADSASVAAALQLCRPQLERRVSGDISAISVDASLGEQGWTVIRGPMVALIGMGEPEPGHASTHHLIRAEYDFLCWVKFGRVQKIIVNREH